MRNLITPPSANAQTIAITGTALLSFNPLSTYVSMGRSRIYALIDDCNFPPPIKIGRSSRWVKSEIDAWIDKQIAARQYELDQVGA